LCFDFSLRLLPDTFLILRRNEWGTYHKRTSSSCKYPLFSSDFIEGLLFWIDYRIIPKHQILCKPDLWEPSCYSDRQIELSY
jgi:hypothetical protein